MARKKSRLEIRIIIEDEKEIAMIEQKRNAIAEKTGLKKSMIDKRLYFRSAQSNEQFNATI